MKILDIRVLGDPILRKATTPVEEVTDDIRSLISDMFDTMYAAEGIGLAAPQVGRTERITVMDVEGRKFALVNPEIIEREGTQRGEEGCLSIPDIFGEVTRSGRVMVRALNEKGEQIEAEGTELLARCMQHEIDHLDGKLFIDYLSMLKRRSAMSKWEKMKDDYPNFIRRVALEKHGPHHSEGEL
ncbi:MAG TPA: peptide deformylase [Gemmatimonadaceae bacterium]|nr:peptide deformylase [Gemmatimonadaceae bacterium]